jgi:hypothetical protein
MAGEGSAKAVGASAFIMGMGLLATGRRNDAPDPKYRFK